MPEKELSSWADVDRDFEDYQRVVMHGNGVADWLRERSATRLDRWEQAAREGYTRGMVLLGECYEKGLGGVPQDDEQAVDWYRKAAEAGNALAMYNLGWMYEYGRGVPQDEKQVVEWYRKAAEAGNVAAMYNLGWMYAKGRGVPQDEKQAVEWLHKAAQAGHPLAPGALKRLNR